MSTILHIETSTRACSVALSEDGQNIFTKSDLNGPSHAALLGGFVEEAISFADSHAIPLDAVAISEGPGSYTGLRIGTSTAKGICYGRDIKLIAIPTPKILCVPVLLHHDLPEDALLCPMIDARRMEVYCAVYDRGLRPKQDISAQIVTPDFLKDISMRQPVYIFGDGAEKCKTVLQDNTNVYFIDNIVPLAKNMMPLAEKAMALGTFEDTAYFEPFYLKEFVTSTPKKLI